MLMRDEVVVVCVVLAFAILVTDHLAIVWGLASRRPMWRALVALVVPPFAPYWSYRERMRVRAGIWVGAVAVYAVALALAAH